VAARLARPTDADDARQRSLLWDDVRAAKELLSRTASVVLRPPLLGVDAPLTRPEFEEIISPLVQRTVRTTAAMLRAARTDPADLAALFLVGGSSRIPLVSTALHRALDVAPVLTEQPELVVAEGSLRSVGDSERAGETAGAAVPRAGLLSAAVVPPPAAPPPADDIDDDQIPHAFYQTTVPRAHRRRSSTLIGIAGAMAALLTLVAAGAWAMAQAGGRRGASAASLSRPPSSATPATRPPGASGPPSPTSRAPSSRAAPRGDLTIKMAGQCRWYADRDGLWLKAAVVIGWTGPPPFPVANLAAFPDKGTRTASGPATVAGQVFVTVGGEPVQGNAFLGQYVSLPVVIDQGNLVAEKVENNNMTVITVGPLPTTPPGTTEVPVPCH
jgi:hypothetical protein